MLHAASLLASLAHAPSAAHVPSIIFINSQMTEGAFNQQRARFTHSVGGFRKFPGGRSERESKSCCGRSPFFIIT